MDVREKLVEMLRNAHKKCKAKKTCHECEQYGNGSDCVYAFMADDIIAHGVTVRDGKDNNVPTNWIYRVTYNGFGIYDAYKKLVGKEEWLMFLHNENNIWLPKPPYYNDTCKSYFTEKGLEQFKKLTLPVMLEKLEESKINITTFKVYQDDFQKVVALYGSHQLMPLPQPPKGE